MVLAISDPSVLNVLGDLPDDDAPESYREMKMLGTGMTADEEAEVPLSILIITQSQ